MKKPRPLLLSILLGPLTIVVTPFVALLLMGPLLLMSRISERLNPLLIISRIFHLEDLEGVFVGVILLGLFVGLLGDVATSCISWRILRSKRFALVTFASAVACQFLLIGAQTALLLRKGSERAEESAPVVDWAKTFETYAALGDLRAEAAEPFPDNVFNPHEELGPLYYKLTLVVPIDVKHAGQYKLSGHYDCTDPSIDLTTPWVDSVMTFAVGRSEARVDLRSPSTYWFWTPRAIGGRAMVRLEYLASQKERYDAMRASMSERGWKDMEAFLKKEASVDTMSRPMPVTTKLSIFPGGERFKPKPKRRPSQGPDRRGD